MTLGDEDIQKLLNTFVPVFATKEDLAAIKAIPAIAHELSR